MSWRRKLHRPISRCHCRKCWKPSSRLCTENGRLTVRLRPTRKPRSRHFGSPFTGWKKNVPRSASQVAGIRSATFGLGILQGLARCGLLDKFHYLSTVSGGGYIGSWLSAWIKNEFQREWQEVVKELNHPPDSTLDPEPPPIRHLRKFSNYLTPKTGLMSVDFWTLIATFIRNMFLNWLVLISCLAAAMMIPRLYLASIRRGTDWRDWKAPVEHHWNIGLTIVLAVGFALIAIAMAYAIIDVPSTGNARYSQRRFLWFRQLPLFLASLILAAWWAVFRNVHGSEPFQSKEWLPWFVGFTVAELLKRRCACDRLSLHFHKSGRKRLGPGGAGRRIRSCDSLRSCSRQCSPAFAFGQWQRNYFWYLAGGNSN